MAKQRGIMRSIVDSNARLMRAGYNKLIEEQKAKQGALKEKLRFVIAALTDKDKQFMLMAYNGMKIVKHGSQPLSEVEFLSIKALAEKNSYFFFKTSRDGDE